MLADSAECPTNPCDAVLIVPPFAGIDRPSLGLHLLQACAASAGLSVKVLYSNIAFAELIGVDLYEAICFAPTSDLLGERVFSRVAFGRDAAYRATAAALRKVSANDPLGRFGARLEDIQAKAAVFVEAYTALLGRYGARVFGCTTTFEQTSASVALLKSIKCLLPGSITLIGGANCDGSMAEGVAGLTADIDYVFSGESERTFPSTLRAILAGIPPVGRVIPGSPCREMDALPTPDYSEYYQQLAAVRDLGRFDHAELAWLPYEASRGCWWGEKNHCTFCGINGSGMAFREKSPDKVVNELIGLVRKHPNKKVLFVDNIMPVRFFDTVLPMLERVNDGFHMFYEQKANLTLEKMQSLSVAGIKVIQPGIESLSTPLLRRMKKGVSASQNIALLRYALAFDVAVNWNMLHDFPGDEESDYEEILRIVPKITHLNPPTGLCQLSIDRFSPYFDQPTAFGVSNIVPMAAYLDVYPDGVDAKQIAYHFVGEYNSASRREPALVERMERAIETWRAVWTSEDRRRPMLHVDQLDEELFVMMDTRDHLRGPNIRFLDHAGAKLALSVQKPQDWDDDRRRWALDEAGVALDVDGILAPLATASREIMRRFDSLKFSGP